MMYSRIKIIHILKDLAAWIITLVKLKDIPRGRRISYSAIVARAVRVGRYTYIGGYSEVRGVLSEVTIGNYCSIGRHVKIFSSGQAHRFDGLSTYPFFLLDPALDRRNFNISCQPTIIGHDVWIGSNVTIMAGVRVGNGAVIGSGAVVTKDVPPYSIVVGIPASKIRDRFDSAIVNAIEQSRWWDCSYKELKKRYPDLIVLNQPLKNAAQLE